MIGGSIVQLRCTSCDWTQDFLEGGGPMWLCSTCHTLDDGRGGQCSTCGEALEQWEHTKPNSTPGKKNREPADCPRCEGTLQRAVAGDWD